MNNTNDSSKTNSFLNGMVEFITFGLLVNKILFLPLLFQGFPPIRESNSNTLIKILIKCVSFLKAFFLPFHEAKSLIASYSGSCKYWNFFLLFWWVFFNSVKNHSNDDWKLISSFVPFYRLLHILFGNIPSGLCYIW